MRCCIFTRVYTGRKAHTHLSASYERRGTIHALRQLDDHRSKRGSNSFFPGRRTHRSHLRYHYLLEDFRKSWLQWCQEPFDVNTCCQSDYHHHVRLQRVAGPARTQPAAPDGRRKAGWLPAAIFTTRTVPATGAVWTAAVPTVRSIPTVVTIAPCAKKEGARGQLINAASGSLFFSAPCLFDMV